MRKKRYCEKLENIKVYVCVVRVFTRITDEEIRMFCSDLKIGTFCSTTTNFKKINWTNSERGLNTRFLVVTKIENSTFHFYGKLSFLLLIY